MEVNQVATVTQQASGGYQVTVTETELGLIKAALAETERVSRFGIEVLHEAVHARDAEPAENSRLRREIEALAMREASLRSLQKTMSEIDRDGKPAPRQHADLDQLKSRAALPVPRPR
jgi:DNA repair exonuclease SbcCD ATPase subunit